MSLANRAQQCCAPTDDPTLLKHAAELEVEFAVAGVAIAAADDEWTEGGFGEEDGMGPDPVLLQKPFQLNVLARTIREVIETRSRR